MKTAKEQPELWLDLTSVSCRAAIEIDNLISGVASEVASVGRLSSLLASLVSVTKRDPNRFEFQDDPAAFAAISEAMGSAADHAPAGTISRVNLLTVAQLQSRAEALRQQFDNVTAAVDAGAPVAEDLKSLRAFCLALAASFSRNDTLDDYDDDHPYMR